MSFAEVGAFGEIHFYALGTPEGEAGRTDLSSVYAAAEALAPHLASPCLVVGEVNRPGGDGAAGDEADARDGAGRRRGQPGLEPGVPREGLAVRDSLAPDRIVLGVASDRAEAPRLRVVYRGPLEAGTPLLVMDLETAELVKVAANAFLATQSFINAMAEVCQQAGADVLPLAEALGYDARIGRRLPVPGLGYGGGCLPKDIRGFRAARR